MKLTTTTHLRIILSIALKDIRDAIQNKLILGIMIGVALTMLSSQALPLLLKANAQGEPPWELLFKKLGDYFDDRFGADWKEKDREFWSEFSRNYQIGKGIQSRLKSDKRIRGMGV